MQSDIADDDITPQRPCAITTAAHAIAAEHLGYAGLSDFIADTLPSAQFIEGMLRRTYRGMERGCDHTVATILCAGALASGDSVDAFPQKARAEAQRIVEKHGERITMLAEVIAKLAEIEPVDIDDDVIAEDVCVVEHVAA
jgi:hypothetical protein